MKKALSIILAVTAMLSALSACSNPQQEDETTQATSTPQTQATEKQTEILGGVATQGDWGETQWILYHSGELVFSGASGSEIESDAEEQNWSAYNEYIKKIIISEGITAVDESVFSGMQSLESVSLPLTLNEIDEYAFADCPKLKEISLPDGVVSVEEYAFANSGLEKIKIGAAAAQISPLCFDGCKITDIQVSEKNPNYSTDKYGVLFNKDKTTLIRYSCGFLMNSYTVPDGVTLIGSNAFNNEYLNEVVLPQSLTEIGENAFEGCLSLKTVEIPSTVTEIGSGAFRNCRSLKEFAFPDGITHIRSEVLDGCDSLETVNVPASVVYIGEKAFGSQATFEINYDGSKESWKNISVAENNSAVSNAQKHYGLSS